MEDKIINFEKYQKLLELQKLYEEDLVEEDEMTLEQINALIDLYKKQINNIENNIKQKIYIKKAGDNK